MCHHRVLLESSHPLYFNHSSLLNVNMERKRGPEDWYRVLCDKDINQYQEITVSKQHCLSAFSAMVQRAAFRKNKRDYCKIGIKHSYVKGDQLWLLLLAKYSTYTQMSCSATIDLKQFFTYTMLITSTQNSDFSFILHNMSSLSLYSFSFHAHTGTLIKQITQMEHLKQIRLIFELTS